LKEDNLRPLGVTLIGWYQILRGALAVLFAAGLMTASGLAAKLASLASEGNLVERLLSGFGHSVGIFILVIAALHLAAGFGVLGLKNWGRWLTLIFSALGCLIGLRALAHPHPMALILAVINLASLVYLLMPEVRRIFA
jgi:uncharacterized membrane protein (DUF2068 family)